MRLLAAAIAAGVLALAGPALAQDRDGSVVTVTRAKGGAVYDVRRTIEGGAAAGKVVHTTLACGEGLKSLRVMLPVSPADDGTVFSHDGPKSTLKKLGGTWQVSFLVDGQRIRRTMELKPVNDPKSQNRQQFVVRVDYGGPLWAALTSAKGATMLIGQGGMPVTIPTGPKLDAALKACGLSG